LYGVKITKKRHRGALV